MALSLWVAMFFLVLAGVFMGVQLSWDGTKLVVDTAADIRWWRDLYRQWQWFFLQLLRPMFQKAVKHVSDPEVCSADDRWFLPLPKLFLMALLVIAVAWPFMVSRGAADIANTHDHDLWSSRSGAERGGRATGLLVLGYGGLRHRRLYLALLNHYYGLGFWTRLPLAGLSPAAAGFLLGFPVLRLRGDYLAIVTLGFGEIVRILLLSTTLK